MSSYIHIMTTTTTTTTTTTSHMDNYYYNYINPSGARICDITVTHAELQGRPKAPPATQNASQKSLGGTKISKLGGTKFTFLF